jgi:WD40 repeat protein
MKCPHCYLEAAQVGAFWICPTHGQLPEPQPFSPLRIFLSYGHDSNEELVRCIKTDLENRGHDVWFDKTKIRPGDDWRACITEGILKSNRFLSFLSKYSTRDPGVCLDEIAVAIGAKGGNIQTILVESEREVQPPPSISHIQWLDMHDWKERRNAGEVSWQLWYQAKLAEIIAVVESDESRCFAGEIKTLEDLLKPTVSDFAADSRVRQLLEKKLIGRMWLFEAVENWRNNTDRASRLFWIMGAPGIGKSAFAAHLAHEYGRGTVIAAQFCDWKKPDHRDAGRIIRTLAFQIASRLPDYRKLLLTLPIMTELGQKNSAELFHGLLTNPLKLSIAGRRERYLIVIDALDEAGADGRNELVEVLARYARQLPEWIGLVVTSRPEFDVTTPFQELKPIAFDTKSEANTNDIRHYLRSELLTQLQDRPNADRLVERILDKSEGVFLYVESFSNDIRKNYLSLDRPDEFPQGLAGKFVMDFQRYFPNLEQFRNHVRPALRAILAAREPLPIEILQRLCGWQDEELAEFTRPVSSIFPVTNEAGHKVIKSYHKALADWLRNENQAGSYFVSLKEGHRALADSCWSEYLNGVSTLSTYALRHLPSHLTSTARWDDLTQLLRDLTYLESKVRAGGAFELVADFTEAVAALPQDHPRSSDMWQLKEALRREIHFIAAHAQDYPQALFQCLWNSCWWYDTPELQNHISNYASLENHVNGFGFLYKLLESWLRDKQRGTPGFVWLRSLRPPEYRIGQLHEFNSGHQHTVTGLALSPDESTLVSCARNGSIRIWDTTTFALNAELQIFSDEESNPDELCIPSVSISDDSKYLIASSYWRLQPHNGLSGLVCGQNMPSRLAVWSYESFRQQWIVQSVRDCTALTVCKGYAAMLDYNSYIYLFKLGSAFPSAAPVRFRKVLRDIVCDELGNMVGTPQIRFSPCGKHLTVFNGTSSANTYGVPELALESTIQLRGDVLIGCFTDNIAVFNSHSNRVHLLSKSSGELIFEWMPAPGAKGCSAAASDDANIFWIVSRSSAEGAAVYVHCREKGKTYRFQVPSMQAYDNQQIVLNETGTMAAIQIEGNLFVVDMTTPPLTGEALKPLFQAAGGHTVEDIAMSPDSAVLAVIERARESTPNSAHVAIYDVVHRNLIQRVAQGFDRPRGIYYNNSKILVWDTFYPPFEEEEPRCEIRLLDLLSGQLLCRLSGDEYRIQDPSVIADGLISSICSDGIWRFWDLATGTLRDQIRVSAKGPIVPFENQTASTKNINHHDSVFSADVRQELLNPANAQSVLNPALADTMLCRRIVSGEHAGSSFEKTTVFDCGRPIEIRSFLNLGHISCVSYSRDRRKMAVAIDSSVFIWDLRSGRLETRFVDQGFEVAAIAMNYSGDRIYTAGFDQKIRVREIGSTKNSGSYRHIEADVLKLLRSRLAQLKEHAGGISADNGKFSGWCQMLRGSLRCDGYSESTRFENADGEIVAVLNHSFPIMRAVPNTDFVFCQSHTNSFEFVFQLEGNV